MRSYIGLKFFPSAKEKSTKILKEEEKFGRLKLGESIYFATGSSIIRDTERIRLDVLINEIKNDHYISKLVIEGYASTIGNEARNLRLSEQRSKAVKEYFISAGIEVKDIELVKYGSEKADKININQEVDRKVRVRVYRRR